MPGNAQALKETEVAAAAFGVKLQYLDDIETAFRAASKGRADAVLFLVAGGVAADQFENREADRPHDSAECAGAGGQGDQVKLGTRLDCPLHRIQLTR